MPQHNIKPVAVIILDVKQEINSNLLSALKKVGINDVALLPLCPAKEESSSRCPGKIMQEHIKELQKRLLNEQFTVLGDYSNLLYDESRNLRDFNVILECLKKNTKDQNHPYRYVIFKNDKHVSDITMGLSFFCTKSKNLISTLISDIKVTNLDFISAAKALRLRVACENYLHHLKQPKEDADITQTETKQAIVEQLWELTKSPSLKSLQQFGQILKENRTTLEARRDSATLIFLKVLLSFFTLGIAAACGLWSIEGKKVTADMELTLSPNR